MGTTKPAAASKTIAEQHVRGLQATEMELGQTEAALQQMNQQMRAMNARRQRLIEGRATILRLLGLDPTKLYEWTAAKAVGRYVPQEVTQEEMAVRVQRMQAAQVQAQTQQMAAVPGATPDAAVAAGPAESAAAHAREG